MLNFISKHVLSVTLMVFVVTVVTVIVYLINMGRSYRSGLENWENDDPLTEAEIIETRKIKRVTLQKDGDSGCVEVAPDGAVRIYKECGQDAENAFRSTEARQLRQILRIVSSGKLSTTYVEGAYKLTVEYNDKTVTYYIPPGNSVPGGGGDIGDKLIDIIDDVVDDAPTPSPTIYIANTITPTPIVIPGESPTPTVWMSNPSPTPTPVSGDVTPVPFTCDFTDQYDKKPYRVSSVVCTSEPTVNP